MNVGFATVDATPPVGTYLGGYARWGASDGVRDRLEASAIAFANPAGEGAIVLLLDLVFIHHEVTATVRARLAERTGVPAEHILVNCSHSHATPYGAPGDRGAAHHRMFTPTLVERCVEAGIAAWNSRAPAELAVREGCSDLGVNRRLSRPDGTADFGWNETGSNERCVHVLTVDRGGRRLFTLAAYPCHPIVFSPANRKVSADWVGAFRRTLAAQTGAPAVFMQGGCADVNPRHEWSDHDSEACEHLGARFAADVLRTLDEAAPASLGDGPIRGATRAVPLDLTPEIVDGRPLPYWRGVVRDKPLPKLLADALRWRCFPWTTRVARGDDGTWRIPLDVHALRVGDLAIAAQGSEAFHQTGASVRRRSPFPHTIFAGYANDMIGYVPPPAEIPRRGYEVDTVPYLYALPGRFAPTAEPAAVEATVALLEALRNDDDEVVRTPRSAEA
mgnify:CR=1 FL=1